MSNQNFMEYLYETHKSQLTKGADYIALLCHSILLDKKCKLKSGKAVLPQDWNHSDPIRLVYTTPDNIEINMSIVETSGDVFVNATESQRDRLGSMEVIADDYLRMNSSLSLSEAYPRMTELTNLFEEKVWQEMFPVKTSSTKETQSKLHHGSDPCYRVPYHNPPVYSPGMDPNFGMSRFPPDYGRADLDPFGLGRDPLRVGPSRGPLGGGGGMLFDPRGGMSNPPVYPGAPPLAGPPGARIDPIYPQPQFPGGRGRGSSRPDPDMPYPPGWEDMYL